MTIDDKVRNEKLRYEIDRKDASMSILLVKK